MPFRFALERDELEQRLGGGFPEGSLVVVEGEYGSGKSVLFERFLYGFLRNRLKCTLVSTELTTLHFIEQMYSLDYPVEEFILDRRLLFLPVYPILSHRGRKNDLIERLLGAKRMYEQDVVVFDTYSSLVKNWVREASKDPKIDVVGALEETLFLFKLLTAHGKTVMLGIEPGDLDHDFAARLQSSADQYFTLKIDNVGGQVSRSLFVRRFERASANVADIVPFRVEPKSGFIVEIKTVS